MRQPHRLAIARATLPTAAAALALGAVAALVTAAPGRSEPPAIAGKRAEAEQVLGQIRDLDSHVARTVDEYNRATIKLADVRAELTRNGAELRVARHNLRRSRTIIARRLVRLYQTGDSESVLSILLGSNSLNDVIERLDTSQRVGRQDVQVAREVARYRSRVAANRVRLLAARRRQAGIVAELRSRRASIERQLAARQRLLGSIRGEIVRLEREERARQERLAAQARARLAAQQRAQRARVAQVTVGATAVVPAAEAPDPAAAQPVPPPIAVAPPSRYTGVVGVAMRYLGVPYRWGGASPATGFDCSGFIMYAYAQVGVSLPHYTVSQYQLGVPVARDQLQPGDIVFFDGLGHNGMYIGGGQFIHAPHTGDVVKISSLSDSWYAARWVGARRVV